MIEPINKIMKTYAMWAYAIRPYPTTPINKYKI